MSGAGAALALGKGWLGAGYGLALTRAQTGLELSQELEQGWRCTGARLGQGWEVTWAGGAGGGGWAGAGGGMELSWSKSWVKKAPRVDTGDHPRSVSLFKDRITAHFFPIGGGRQSYL